MATTPKEERVVEIIVNGTKANASLKEMGAAAAVLSNQVAKIAADDPKRAELIAQLQQMRQRITDTRAEVNGLVQSQEQLAAAQAATVASQQQAIAAGQRSTASFSEMKTAAGLLEKQLLDMSADDPGRAALIADFQQLKTRMGEARAEMDRVIKSEADLRAETEALHQAQAEQLAAQQRTIAAGRQSTASFVEMKAAAGVLEKQLQELSADDPGRAALIRDYQSLQARLGEARAEMTRVVKTAEELRAEQEALRASQVQLVVNGQRVSASMREMREAAAQLESELEELGQDDPARGPLIAALQQMRARIHDVQQEVAGVTATTSTMKSVMTNAFAFAIGGGIEQGIEKVVEMGKSIFTTTAKFETYGKVMENALGSKSLAQQAMKDITDMAAKTPISVDTLTSSFLKFVNRGLQPSMAEMTKLGDLASSQAKDFDQLTEAVLDAGTGEFERLKEFGIGASKSGDQVTLSFKGVNQTVSNTPAAIQGAIVAMGEMKGVAGSMKTIAEGLDGQLSNLGDTADQTAVEWGQTLRPVFVAVLGTLGFLLGILKELPSFIKENRGALLGLGAAVLALNAEQVILNGLVLANVALEKGRAIATRASAAAQWLLNTAMSANPIGVVIALVVALVGAFVTLYERSEKVRAVISGLGQALLAFGKTYVQGLIQQFTGLGDVILGAFTLDPERIKKGLQEVGQSVKTIYYDAGKNAATAYSKGYDEKAAADVAASVEKQGNLFEKFAKAYQARLDAALKARIAAEAAARMEALKNEEAALRVKLARVQADSEAEMRLKQRLVTNEEKQALEDIKKTTGERAVIRAEAEQKRTKLAQEFYEKAAKAREEARKKAAAEALKARLAEIEAEQHHQEMLIKLRQAAMIARGDERVSELSAIYTDGELKIAALQAASKKEIAQLTGTVAQKKARTIELEKELGAEVALVKADVLKKQGELTDKFNREDVQRLEKFIDQQVEAIEDQATRQQAAFEVMLDAGLQSQQQADRAKYEARQAAFAAELELIEGSLGKESAAYKKVFGAMVKDQADFGKKEVAEREKAFKAKRQLQQAEMATAGDVLNFGLDLLGQDEEARKKHHTLYTALAAAKIVIDGTKEVQQIWEYSAENPANGPTAGAAGIAMGAIQTAIAIGRTAVALGQLRGGGGDQGGSYAKGGATGDGAGLAVSPMGQLMQMSGMSVGSSGKLLDGSGFAVAGVVHEDEYVIPKWQLQDPQVAAVAQWLEARRMRGFADGGPTSSSVASLPVPVASPSTDGEKTYAVQTQMLTALQAMNEQLADVKQWQRDLNVRLDLRATQSGLDEYKQVSQAGAIRKKG
jgi:hypothetical protein